MENPPICYLTYNSKSYPINLQSLIFHSRYIFKKRATIKEGDKIPLIEHESNIQYSDDLIQYFISICECKEQLKLSNENVYPLYELSKFYEIPFIIKEANDYIKQNTRKLILQEFLYNDDKKRIHHRSSNWRSVT